MRKHGTINEVWFEVEKYCVANLAYKYRITAGEGSKTVYVENMKQLRKEIDQFNGVYYEESEV